MKTLRFRVFFALGTLTSLFAAAAPSQAVDLPDGPNRDLVATKCADCHDLSVITSKRFSANDWRTKVKIMAAQGVQVSPQEVDQIVDYLSTWFGLTPPPKK